MAEQEDTPLTASPAPRPGQVGPVHQRKSCGTSILKWAAIIVSIGAVGYFVLGAVTPVATQGSIGGGVGVGNGSSNTHYLDGGGRSEHAAALMQGATSQLRDAVDEMEAKAKEEEKAKTKEEEKVKAQVKEEENKAKQKEEEKAKEKEYDAELDRQLSGELLVLSNQLRDNDPNDTWYVR